MVKPESKKTTRAPESAHPSLPQKPPSHIATTQKSSSDQTPSVGQNAVGNQSSDSFCPVSSLTRSASEERYSIYHTLTIAFLLGIVAGGLLVYSLAPPSLRLDSSFFSLCNSNKSHSSSCPAAPPCPKLDCPPYSYITSNDELLNRGSLASNPKNAPSADKYEAPRILPLEAFVTPEEAVELIATVTEKESFEAGQVSNPAGQNRTFTRRVSMAVLSVRDQKYRWLYERLLETIKFYNSQYWQYRLPSNVDSTLLEPIQFYKYDSQDQGHYNWHSDVGIKGLTAKRRLSVSVQLSPEDAYEGGDLVIKPSSDEIPLMRKQGTMFLFPSFLLHKVTPVTKGVRYSLVAWIETA